MRRLCILLLFCIMPALACWPRGEPQLYIYCSETFWYVMQEKVFFFNRIYGFQVILIPIRADRAETQTEDAVVMSSGRLPLPSEWLSSPGNRTDPVVPYAQLNPDIVEHIRRITASSIGDLFLTDSAQQLALINTTALAASEIHVCYLTLTMLVPNGNPLHFRSVKDVIDANRRLGIINPSFDGLGEASWQVLGNIIPGGESDILANGITFYERQYDLLEALESGEIDAILVWTFTSQISFIVAKYAAIYNAANEQILRDAARKGDREGLRAILQEMHRHLVETKVFAEEVPLLDNPGERYVVSVPLISLSTASNFGHTKRFVDFTRSNYGREILRRYGFIAE